MVREAGAEPGSKLLSKVGILITSLVLYGGGIFQAWRALHVEHAVLPLPALQRIAAHAQNSGASSIRSALCQPSLPISIVTFSSPAEGTLQPLNFAQELSAVAPPYLPLIEASDFQAFTDLEAASSAIEHCEMSKSSECTKSKALSPQELSQLGWNLNSQLPSSADIDSLTVLVVVTPNGVRPLQVSAPSNRRVSNRSYQLSEQVLLVLMNGNEKETLGRKFTATAAEEILNWLLSGVSDTEDSTLIGKEIHTACLHKISEGVATFLRIVEAGKDNNVAVTWAIASAAEGLVAAFSEAQTSLEGARIVHKHVAELIKHPDLAQRPHMPPEHILAILLPIGLPVSLALVQALGREAKAYRKGKTEVMKEKES